MTPKPLLHNAQQDRLDCATSEHTDDATLRARNSGHCATFSLCSTTGFCAANRGLGCLWLDAIRRKLPQNVVSAVICRKSS
jgi:hypothetical protein